MIKPKKWHEVYSSGTKEGEEEARLFKVLARNPKWPFQSISSIVKATKLSKTRVEEIIEKYAVHFNPPLIYKHEENDDNWGYWERCPGYVKAKYKSLSQKDIEKRIAKHRSKDK